MQKKRKRETKINEIFIRHPKRVIKVIQHAIDFQKESSMMTIFVDHCINFFYFILSVVCLDLFETGECSLYRR